MSLASKFTTCLLLTTALPLAILATTTFWVGRQAVSEQIGKQLLAVAELQAKRVEQIADRNLERLSLLTSRTQMRVSLRSYLRDEDPQHLGRVTRIITDARDSIRQFQHIWIATNEGRVVASTDPGLLGEVQADRPYFQMGVDAHSVGQLEWTQEGVLLMYLSGPLQLDGQPLGVLVVQLHPNSLCEVVDDYTGLGASGETMLVKNTGGGGVFLLPLRFDADAPRSRPIDANSVSQPESFALAAQNTSLVRGTGYRGQQVVAAIRRLEIPDWSLVVQIERAEAYGWLNRLVGTAVLLVVVAAFSSILVGGLLVRAITHPISLLTRQARSIAQTGDDGSARPPTSEAEVLESTFERMVAELEERNREISEKLRSERSMNQTLVDRELQMIELKQRVNSYAVASGEPAPFDLRFVDDSDPVTLGP